MNLIYKLKSNALIKKAFLDSNYYLIAQLGTKLLGLLVIPFLARMLVIEDFARYDIFLMVASISHTIVVLGVDSGMAIMIADHKQNNKLINYLFSFSILSSIGAILILWVISVIAFPYIEYTRSLVDFITLLFFYILFNLISYQVFNFLRWMGKAGLASTISFISYTAGVGLGILLLFLNKQDGLYQYLLGLVIGNFIGAIVSLSICYKHFTFNWIPEYRGFVSELFKLSLPFVPNYLANSLMMISDRIVVVSIFGDKALAILGVYALANRFAQIPSFLLNVITRGFQPVMYLHYKEPEGKELNKKIYNYMNYAIIPVFITVFLGASFIVDIFGGQKFQEAIPIIPIVTVTAFVYGIMGVNGMGFTIQRKTYYITLISVFSILVNVILTFTLGISFGLFGLAFAALISASLTSICYSYFSEKLYSFNFNLIGAGVIYLAVSILVILFYSSR